MTALSFFQWIWPTIAPIAMAALAWWQIERTRRADRAKSDDQARDERKGLIQLSEDIASRTIARLEKSNDDLRAEIVKLQEKNDLLRGEVAQLKQTIVSMRRVGEEPA